jgi:hypothetical protein
MDITKYTWDHRDRLTAVKSFVSYVSFCGKLSEKVVDYKYDHLNRWIYKNRDPDGFCLLDE